MRSTVSLVVLLPCTGLAQVVSPASRDHRWVVEQFFFASAWPTKHLYYTGEMQTHYGTAKTLGEVGALVRRSSLRQVSITEGQAVYAVEVLQGDRVEDWYAYLAKRDSLWRLRAVRTLALPPLFFLVLDSLSGTTPLPDSLVPTVENMRLTASSDSALKGFFLARRSAIDQIAGGFARETVGSIAAAPDGLKAPTPSLRLLAEQLATLHLRGAWRDPEFPECIFVEVGGMIDNEVGFMRCTTDRSIPPMNPERFILIDLISPGWYLYKTT